MLNQLRIRNFKSWQDTGCIRMAPITLFFGANSSGKSSIGQFLLMLKQTIESPDRKAVFYPGGRNSAVQLGSYQEMVFRRNPNKKITFEYQWSLPKHMEIGDPLSDDVFSGDKLHFSAEVERGNAKPFEEIIAGKLKRMKLINAFRVKPISAQRQEYEVQVGTKGSKDWVDLPDVGFGVSQVLPVLAQCFYAPPGSIMLMEQPEIHLHPSAQSALADVMIDAIGSRENRKERGIQLIIESHSEHFLRRLQRRIAEGYVLKEEVSAYFANITRTPATLEPLDIDDYGNIENWPQDFFGDEMGDIIEQSKAAIKARGQNANKSRQRK